MVEHGLRAYPNLKIQTRAGFEKSQRAQVNQLLALVYALLALAVVIALIGIVNTLMLSVFERTHEIGLLRAVGMKRRQVRVHDPIGVGHSLRIRRHHRHPRRHGARHGLFASLKQQGITDIVIPGGSLVIFLILAALLGLGAASWPARRAGKLDVLTAIATD